MEHDCIQKDRIAALEKTIIEMRIQNAVTETNYANIMTMLNDIKTDLCAIKEKPAKRWEILIAAVLCAVIGFMFNMFK